jgi:hypothetical protein
MTETLVDRIYEAAFTPEAWPDVLDELAKIADARGGHVTVVSAKGVSFKGLGLLADADQKGRRQQLCGPEQANSVFARKGGRVS